MSRLYTLSHLFQALFTEGTLGRMVQAALQTVFTEGVATWSRHRLVEQPAFTVQQLVLHSQSLKKAQCVNIKTNVCVRPTSV